MYLLTLCSLFVIVFLIFLTISVRSFAGRTTLESMSSISGLRAVRSSSMSVRYWPMFLIVASADGFLPRMSYSDPIGENNVAKDAAKWSPETRSAGGGETRSQGDRKGCAGGKRTGDGREGRQAMDG